MWNSILFACGFRLLIWGRRLLHMGRLLHVLFLLWHRFDDFIQNHLFLYYNTLLVDILIFDLHLLLSKEKILGLSSKTHGHGISRTFSDSLKNIFLTWEKFQFEKSKKLIKVDSSSYHVEISQVFRKVIFGVSFEFLNLLHKSNSRIRAVIWYLHMRLFTELPIQESSEWVHDFLGFFDFRLNKLLKTWRLET